MAHWKLIFYAVSAVSLATNVMTLVGTAKLLRPSLPLLYALGCIILVAMVVAKTIALGGRRRRRRTRRRSAPLPPPPFSSAATEEDADGERNTLSGAAADLRRAAIPARNRPQSRRSTLFTIEPFQDSDTRFTADNSHLGVNPDMDKIVQPDVHEPDGQTRNVHNMVQPAHIHEPDSATPNINYMEQPAHIQELGMTPDILQLDITPNIDHPYIHHHNDHGNKSHNVLGPHLKSHDVPSPHLTSHNLLGPHLTLHRPRRDDQLDRDELHQRAENFIIKFKRSLTMQREASYNRLLALLHSKSVR